MRCLQDTADADAPSDALSYDSLKGLQPECAYSVGQKMLCDDIVRYVKHAHAFRLAYRAMLTWARSEYT